MLPLRTRRAVRWLAAVALIAAAALAPPLPHEPWLLVGVASGYVLAALDRVFARGPGRHR